MLFRSLHEIFVYFHYHIERFFLGFEITWQTFDLHKNEPDWNLRTEHEGMFSEQGIPIKALIARKGPDSTVTWVEPKALAKQQEAEDDAD